MADVGAQKNMKTFVIVVIALLAFQSLARELPAKLQEVTISRTTNALLTFTVDDGKIFTDIDACGEYCRGRAGSVVKDSRLRNAVNIHVAATLSSADRQYAADRFVTHYVYPVEISWADNGGTNVIQYRLESKNLREKRELK